MVWKKNLFKVNASKCHFSASISDKIRININNYNIENKSRKLLGAKFNNGLTFDDRVSDLCRKASKSHYKKSATIYENFWKFMVFNFFSKSLY